MLTCLWWISAGSALLAAVAWCAAATFRNGDRPGDAQVTARLLAVAHPEEPGPLAVVTVRNPAGAPALTALRTRAALLPAWLVGPYDVSVPRRTLRGRFRPSRYATVGVVPAGGAAEFAAPVPARARGYLLIVAVGQQGGRLRVHRLRLGPACLGTQPLALPSQVPPGGLDEPSASG